MDIRFNEADIVFLIQTLKIIAQLPGLMFFYISFFWSSVSTQSENPILTINSSLPIT